MDRQSDPLTSMQIQLQMYPKSSKTTRRKKLPNSPLQLQSSTQTSQTTLTTSTVHTDVQRIAYDMKTAGKKAKSVRTHRIGRRTQCSPDKPHPSLTINGEGTVLIISTSMYRGMPQMRCRRMRVKVLSLDKSRVQVMRPRPTANMEVTLRTR